MVGQSEKARLVFSARRFRSYRRLTTWKNRVSGASVVGEIPELVQDLKAPLAVVVEPAREATRGPLARFAG
jgi:hypothetical protein